MAIFNIRQWLDRISEYPNRRTLTNIEDTTDVKTYDLSRAEGEVSVQGTALTAANLNDLEGRIEAAFTAVENAMPEANPAETATASLAKLKVAGTVYEVEGGGGGASSVASLTDVVLTDLADEQILKYDATNQKWVNANEAGGELAPQTVVLESTDWDSTTNTITVAVTGVTATSNQEILPLLATSAANIANNKALQACNLMDYGQAAGEITLYAENIPSVDLSIRVIVRA